MTLLRVHTWRRVKRIVKAGNVLWGPQSRVRVRVEGRRTLVKGRFRDIGF